MIDYQSNITISGTAKLKTIRAFNLPPIKTCTPTKECVKYCYGLKGHFLLHSNVYENNLEESKKDYFVEEMNKLLSRNECFFRIHAIGDFYSLDYFKKWIKIAKANKHITFLAYTRVTKVCLLSKPNNFKLIFTVDSSTPIIPSNMRKARVVHSNFKKVKHLSNASIEGIGDYLICSSDNCLECLECWTGKENIAFPQKYPKYDKV